MSTRSLVTVAGGLIGAYLGYPQLGLVLGGLVGGAVDPQTIQGPAINEVAVQTQAEGVPRIIPYGTVSCVGNVIQNGPLIKTTEYSSQGKGGASVETPTAYRTFAIGICEGPIAGMLRVWEDNTLVYDVRPGSLMLAESAKWMQNKFLSTGEESQEPSPFLEFIDPETPAYRGTAYLTFVLENQTDRGGSFKQYRFEVATAVSAPTWPGYGWTQKQTTTWSAQACIATADGVTVASGSGGAQLSWSSSDLSTFTSSSLAPNGASGIAAGNGVFVAIISGTNNYAYVSAGGPWTLISTVSNFEKYGIAYGNGIFVIVGNTGVLGTARTAVGTGGAWTEHNIATAISGVCRFGNGLFVTLQASKVSYSSDGVSWSSAACPSGGADIVWSPELALWVLMRSGAGTSSIATSPNLSTWTVRTTPGTYNCIEWAPELGLLAILGDNGAFATSPDGVTWTSRTSLPSSSYTDMVWDPVNYKFAAVSSSTGRIVVSDTIPGSLGGVPTTDGAIVANIHQRCGIAATLYDVSELTDSVDGFSIAGPYTGADGINGLRAIHMFDKSDHDRKLWYPKRGKAVVKTLTIDDLTEVPDTSQREQAGEIPYKLNLTYQHADSGYAPVKATAPGTPSPDRRTTGEVSMSTALVMNENRAAQAADMIYKITLAEANGTMELSVPLAVAADLADADCIGLSLRGRVTRWRIEQSAFTDWTVKFTLRSDRQSAYTSNVTGIPLPPPTLPPSTIVGDTELAVLDLPARTDTEDDLSYLVAVSGSLPPWYGAQLQRSLDIGATWSNVQQIDQASIMGVLTANVADASEHYTDTFNTVSVQLYRATQTLDNLTELQFLSEQGGFALENADGSWEVMQYRDAEVELDGSITLTTLHRGLLNTGGSAHLAGARFVLLSTATHIAASASWLGLNVTNRAISLGESADDTDNDTTITFAGKSQIEYPVTYLTVARSVGNILTGSWVPRPRFGSDVNPIQSTNLLGYRVTIVGTSTVTLDVPSASFTYDASALGVSVTVSVSALNRITGAGPAVSTTA